VTEEFKKVAELIGRIMLADGPKMVHIVYPHLKAQSSTTKEDGWFTLSYFKDRVCKEIEVRGTKYGLPPNVEVFKMDYEDVIEWLEKNRMNYIPTTKRAYLFVVHRPYDVFWPYKEQKKEEVLFAW